MTLQDGFAPDDQKNISDEGSEKLLQGDQFDVKIKARYKEREDAHSTENDQQARPYLDLDVNPNDVNLKQENDELKFDDVIGEPDFQSSVDIESMSDKQDGDNDETAPRYEVQSRLNSAFSPRSDIFSPRSAYSELRNTSSVRFSVDLLNENEKEEIENEGEKKQRKEKGWIMFLLTILFAPVIYEHYIISPSVSPGVSERLIIRKFKKRFSYLNVSMEFYRNIKVRSAMRT